MSHPEHNFAKPESQTSAIKSPGMQAIDNMLEDAYQFGKMTVGDFQKHGPSMLNAVIEDVKKDPRKGFEAVAVLGLTTAAVIAETPEIIAIASAGAILGGLHLAGEACANQANKWDAQIRAKH
ncbi:MAG: hypothetical protein KIT34_18435 [Cyanobacteria bacterium TGS_CYA1]|nr:hypothetical protein [Cyanobacteria bacterium TGS_CYA1]